MENAIEIMEDKLGKYQKGRKTEGKKIRGLT